MYKTSDLQKLVSQGNQDTMEQRIKILNDIFSNFQQVTQWLPNNIDSACKYIFKAEALIERLEVNDCGSIGGFDQKSPLIPGESGFLLYDRFLAIVRRYGNEAYIQVVQP